VSTLKSEHPGEGSSYWECMVKVKVTKCSFKCETGDFATGAVAKCRKNGKCAGEWKVRKKGKHGLNCTRCFDVSLSYG
jgi:hypothetical protein